MEEGLIYKIRPAAKYALTAAASFVGGVLSGDKIREYFQTRKEADEQKQKKLIDECFRSNMEQYGIGSQGLSKEFLTEFMEEMRETRKVYQSLAEKLCKKLDE